MRLTVLGSGAACPPGGQNSSGYLVETGRDDAGGRRLLLDCGHGVASALLAVRPRGDIDDIWVSHMHADHFIDLLALRFRVSRMLEGVPASQRRITLHLPPGGRACLEAVLAAVSFPADFCDRAFRVREYAPDDVCDAGGVRVRVAPGIHYIPSYAIRVEADGAALCYSGDTAPSESVAALARGADLFICEGTLDAPEDGDVRGHCTPEEAARMAAQAGAGRLLLSHFWYGADTEAFARRARAAVAVPVDAARDGYQRTL